jgi:hypothetical protein
MPFESGVGVVSGVSNCFKSVGCLELHSHRKTLPTARTRAQRGSLRSPLLRSILQRPSHRRGDCPQLAGQLFKLIQVQRLRGV